MFVHDNDNAENSVCVYFAGVGESTARRYTLRFLGFQSSTEKSVLRFQSSAGKV